MLVPLAPAIPGNAEEGHEELPEAVKDQHYLLWNMLGLLFLVLGVFMVLATDASGAMMAFVLAALVLHTARDRCKNMNSCFLFLFGLLCFTEAAFELLQLSLLLGGRQVVNQTSQTSVNATSHEQSIITNTTIQSHPFIDTSMGFVYNMQSSLRIASPCLLFVAALLARWTYRCFPSGMPRPGSYEDDEVQPLWASQMLAGTRSGEGLATYGLRSDHTDGLDAGLRPQPAAFRPFEGRSQRLADSAV